MRHKTGGEKNIVYEPFSLKPYPKGPGLDPSVRLFLFDYAKQQDDQTKFQLQLTKGKTKFYEEYGKFYFIPRESAYIFLFGANIEGNY